MKFTPSNDVELMEVSTAVPDHPPAIYLNELIILKPNTSITFTAMIGGHIRGVASAYWEFVGSARRDQLPSSVSLTGVGGIKVVADSIFANTSIEIDVDYVTGGLRIWSHGDPLYNIHWDADVNVKLVA